MASVDVLRDKDLIAARDRHMTRLERLFSGETPKQPFYLRGVAACAETDPYNEPERWVEGALCRLSVEAARLRDGRVFRPLCLEFGPYGVHFVDRIFGARVYYHAGQWCSDPLDTPVGTLETPDLDRDDTWSLARRVADAFLAHRATVPVFGMPTIASALNVAVNLYGEAFLLALATDEAAAARDLRVINGLLRAMHRWYRTKIPEAQLQPVVAAERCQTPGSGQICGCTTQLLSGPMYRRHIAALDEAVLSEHPRGGMIHLCGAHTQHIPSWRAMSALLAVQLNDRAALDLPAYFDGLRDDQVIYLNPCPGMDAERALALTGGKRLVLVTEPGTG